jgi:hypothetical protein
MPGCCGRRPDRSSTSVPAEPAGPRAMVPSAAVTAAAVPVRPAARVAGPRFRYTGPSVLRVVGPRTGRPYRFEGHGDELDVDPRDAPFLAAVPRLVRV